MNNNLSGYVLSVIFSILCVLSFCIFSWYKNKNKNKKYLMKNFPFKYKGLTYWYSRSCAVVLFAYCKDKLGNLYVLANKRGKGTPDFQGCWNASCGYLDFNETTEEGSVRECYEETGIKISASNITLDSVSSDPKNNRQNVTFYHSTLLNGTIDDWSDFSTKHSEKNEVEEIRWIPITDLSKYQWAFGHDVSIRQHALKFM